MAVQHGTEYLVTLSRFNDSLPLYLRTAGGVFVVTHPDIRDLAYVTEEDSVGTDGSGRQVCCSRGSKIQAATGYVIPKHVEDTLGILALKLQIPPTPLCGLLVTADGREHSHDVLTSANVPRGCAGAYGVAFNLVHPSTSEGRLLLVRRDMVCFVSELRAGGNTAPYNEALHGQYLVVGRCS